MASRSLPFASNQEIPEAKKVVVTILGCGSSTGVPEIGCTCFACRSVDPKNKRLRTSLALATERTTILIDSSPDLRLQALQHGLNKVDAVLYTHAHSDHVNGIDDLKVLCKNKPTPAYMDQPTLTQLEKQFAYVFSGTASGLYSPVLKGMAIEPYKYITIGDVKVLPLLQYHYDMQTLAFRFGDIAYSTDFSQLPEHTLQLLAGVKYWIVGCLRYSWAPTHPYLEKVMRYVYRVKPQQAIFIHMSHQIEYNEISKLLSPIAVAGYDGMCIEGTL